MRIVVALGGNALLRRGQALTAENQRENVRIAAEALAPIAKEHELVVSHGNGPQVGLLALQGAAYKPDEAYPLDVLGAETEGMVPFGWSGELTVSWIQEGNFHAALSAAVAAGDEGEAAAACDRLLDYIESFTRATLDAEG